MTPPAPHRPVPLPPLPPLGAAGDALRAARTCDSPTASPAPGPVTLQQLSAVLGHACGPGPFEARPGTPPGLARARAPRPLLTAGGDAPVPRGTYAYDPVAHALVPRTGALPDSGAGLVLHLPDDDSGERAARVALVAAACGLCTRQSGAAPGSLLLHAGPTAPLRPAAAGAGLDAVLADLPAGPPLHLRTAPAITRQELGKVLAAAGVRTPYRVTVRDVVGLEAGLYAPVADDLACLRPGDTASLAYVLTRGGPAAVAALADAPVTVHLLGELPLRAAEALRLRVAAQEAGLTAWCDDRPAPAAAALLRVEPGGDAVACHVTLGHAAPEPCLRVPVLVPGALS
ncbi:hypothetical protein GCM10010218_38740 [Streptomyces mashuensis]|uniref:Uncharacterized protein n=1 Tax=Streptomyces mashuensis TaxID=33904 RepID=A0A919ECZ2_9ACTN|nr:hypothetical protein [Streptomyces mashuensis]GHF53497.1 hypothetical protein GCM10010218_38740 [Streptomyces mashuensis]